MAKAKKDINIYQKIVEIRKEFKDKDIKKSGHNKFQDFHYHELADIVPIAIDLCEEYKLYTHVNIGTPENKDFATLTVINTEDISESVVYQIKVPIIEDEGGFNARIQDTGKAETYIRRYLYMLFLDIAIPDEVDASDNSQSSTKSKKSNTKGKRTGSKFAKPPVR